VETAFQKDGQSVIRIDWPRPRTSFQKYLTGSSSPVSNKVLEAENLAMHWQALGEGQLAIERPTAAAMALLAIRKANEVLADQPDNAAAFQVLGDAYQFLMGLETEIARSAGIALINQMRYYQTLAAYQQAVLLEPDSLGLHGRLLNLFQTHQRTDLMLRELETLDRLVAKLRPNDPNAEDLAHQRLLLMEQCRSRIDEVREQITKATEAGQSPLELAQQVYAAGFILEAQQLLEQNHAAVSQSPQGLFLRAVLQFESGKIEETYRTFEFEIGGDPSTRMVAAWTKLAHGEYDKAIKLWQDQADFTRHTTLTQVLTTMPLAQSPYAFFGLPNIWPTHHMLTVADAQQRLISDISTLLWYQAMSQLESAKPQLAAKTFQGLLATYPETPFRPLVRFYLQAMTGELIDPEPPSEWIPIDGDMFAPDEMATRERN
jgi:tetratricopeptide (TPR) repeat protein